MTPLCSGNRTSARVNFGTRTSAQIWKNFINFGTNLFRHKSSTLAHVIVLHYAKVNIPKGWCRSPQVGAEVIACRSYSCRTSIAPLQQQPISYWVRWTQTFKLTFKVANVKTPRFMSYHRVYFDSSFEVVWTWEEILQFLAWFGSFRSNRSQHSARFL